MPSSGACNPCLAKAALHDTHEAAGAMGRSMMQAEDAEDIRGSLQEAMQQAMQAAANFEEQPHRQPTSHATELQQNGGDPLQWLQQPASQGAGWGLRQRSRKGLAAGSGGPVGAMIQSLLHRQARLEVDLLGSQSHHVQLEGALNET